MKLIINDFYYNTDYLKVEDTNTFIVSSCNNIIMRIDNVHTVIAVDDTASTVLSHILFPASGERNWEASGATVSSYNIYRLKDRI